MSVVRYYICTRQSCRNLFSCLFYQKETCAAAHFFFWGWKFSLEFFIEVQLTKIACIQLKVPTVHRFRCINYSLFWKICLFIYLFTFHFHLQKKFLTNFYSNWSKSSDEFKSIVQKHLNSLQNLYLSNCNLFVTFKNIVLTVTV